jgi:hypothetical protein
MSVALGKAVLNWRWIVQSRPMAARLPSLRKIIAGKNNAATKAEPSSEQAIPSRMR